MKKIILVAHRGKGPTSKYTNPQEALWQSCHTQGKLAGMVVPQNILEENCIKLPLNTPPENTIASFRQGLEEGADAIELDIFLSKDGVPMAIHDDELNRNVSGARRDAKSPEDMGYLGKVSDYTAEELKEFDMGCGHKIPSLEEVIDFVVLFNRIRIKKNQQSIMLNIEFKDKIVANIEKTIIHITQAAEAKKIIKSNIIYCSFDHDCLAETIRLDEEAQVALALKTAYLFGGERVEVNKGWTVPLGTKYTESAINNLSRKITTMNSIDGGKVVALDAVLWDIEQELIELALSHHLALHASTSDFRDFSNVVFIGNLVQMNKKVQVFFKTDEPAKINKTLTQAYAADKLDLSNAEVVSHEKIEKLYAIQEINNESNQLDLSEVSIIETKIIAYDLEFLRLPKPGQAEPDGYFESLIMNFSEGLANFMNYIMTSM